MSQTTTDNSHSSLISDNQQIGRPTDTTVSGRTSSDSISSTARDTTIGNQTTGNSTTVNGTVVSSGDDTQLMTTDEISDDEDVSNVKWGIFNEDGQVALIGDSILGVDYRQETKIPTFPIEKGGFDSYNKVDVPFDIRITMVKGGTDDDKNEFLITLQDMCESLDLYTVVTPELSYDSVNLLGFDLRRTSKNGASLITVEISIQEVRIVETGKTSSTKTRDTASQSSIDHGTVSGTPTTTTGTSDAPAKPVPSDRPASFSPSVTSPVQGVISGNSQRYIQQ